MAIVKSSLSGLEGVKGSKITLTYGEVWFDPNQVTPERIVQAIRGASYGANIVNVREVGADTIPEDCGFLGLFC